MRDRKGWRTDWDEDEDRPRPRRRRRRGPPLWPFLLLGAFLLAVGAAAVGYLVLRGSGGGPADAAERFRGTWEGTSPGRNSLTLRLVVNADRLTLSARNVRTGDEGSETLKWSAVSGSANKVVIRRQNADGSGQAFEWRVEFDSDDSMRIISMTDKNVIGEFKRVGKMVTRGERNEALAKGRARLVGKWSVPTFQSIKLRSGVLQFDADGTAKFTITYDRNEVKTRTGTWKPLEGDANRMLIEIGGIEDFELLSVEFRSDRELKLSQRSRGGFTGVDLQATRVP